MIAESLVKPVFMLDVNDIGINFLNRIEDRFVPAVHVGMHYRIDILFTRSSAIGMANDVNIIVRMLQGLDEFYRIRGDAAVTRRPAGQPCNFHIKPFVEN